MDFILWCLNIAWKVLVIAAGFMLLRYVIHNGSGAFRDFLDTISLALKSIGHAIRKTCINYLRKEESGSKAKEDIPSTAGTYEEYCKWMSNKS